MNGKIYIAEPLLLVCEELYDVSGNVFPESRPEADGTQMKDMVVVRFSSSVRDNNVQQVAMVRFELIVRNKFKGIADVSRLQEMLDILVSKFPIIIGRYAFTVDKESTVKSEGNDGLGFTKWYLLAKLKTNTTDNCTNI